MEIILYDVFLPKLFYVQIIFVKIILFLLTPRNWNYQTICVHVYTLHSDEVVSLLGLISGCEIVVCSCSPMAVTFYVLLLNRWFILTLTLSYLISFCRKKNAKQIFSWLKKNLIFAKLAKQIPTRR